MWKYFVRKAPVSVCGRVLGSPAAILDLEQIWDFQDKSEPVRKAWRGFLAMMIVNACEMIWGLTAHLDDEFEVDQEIIEDFYRRWRDMPDMDIFTTDPHYDVNKVPIRPYTDNRRRSQATHTD